MRAVLQLFPRQWRDRYGDEFLEQLAADPRRITKAIDVARTAAGLRWQGFRTSDDSPAFGLTAALAFTATCDVALGVGMDSGIDVEVLRHWWGAPFGAALLFSAVAAIGSLIAVLAEKRRRRSWIVVTVAVLVGSIVGTASLAALSFDLAGLGAGLGLGISWAAARVLLRTPFSRADLLGLVALPLILWLGWRSASGPVGPLVLLTVVGALISTRTRAPMTAA